METLLTGGVVDPEGADMTLGSEPELNELFAQFMEELGEVVLKAEQENAA